MLASISARASHSEPGKKEMAELAGTVESLLHDRDSIESFIQSFSEQTIPNLSALAGPVLGSQLMLLAGGLEKLAKLPSSTIQILGAEKALFRHIKGGGKAPKYGILFSHPLVKKAPQDRKSKIARLVASRISLAARVDFFSKEDRSSSMKKEMDKEAAKLAR